MNLQIKELEVKTIIDSLIQAGTTFDVNKLDVIYHKNLQVIMIDGKGEKMIMNKHRFKDLFKLKKENGDSPLNTWAHYNHIEAEETKGHVIVTRKVNLTGTEQKIILSIDLIFEEGRWQVIREVIVNL